MPRVRPLLLLVGLLLTATPSIARAAPTRHAASLLTQLWTTVLETPGAQSSFGAGGQAYACFDLDGTVAPFAPTSAESCTVRTGTWVLIVGYSYECSTFEGNGTTEAELRACAREHDLQSAPAVTVDGRDVDVIEVETPLMHITLPAENILGEPAGAQGLSVGHGWVVLQHPLPPGTHEIGIGDGVTTDIVVERGR
jgi:hypothetical protein